MIEIDVFFPPVLQYIIDYGLCGIAALTAFSVACTVIPPHRPPVVLYIKPGNIPAVANIRKQSLLPRNSCHHQPDPGFLSSNQSFL